MKFVKLVNEPSANVNLSYRDTMLLCAALYVSQDNIEMLTDWDKEEISEALLQLHEMQDVITR